jgi:hypothetical protein
MFGYKSKNEFNNPFGSLMIKMPISENNSRLQLIRSQFKGYFQTEVKISARSAHTHAGKATGVREIFGIQHIGTAQV